VGASANVYDLERLNNLWTVLVTATARKVLVLDYAVYDKHATFLEQALLQLTGAGERPGAALQARAMLLQRDLVRALQAGSALDAVFAGFKEIVQQARGLINFPLEPLTEILAELGGGIGSSPAYDELFTVVAEVVSERAGDVRGARLLLK
jgi:hypothetical protein